MELQVTCGQIGTMGIVFDEVDERPVDCDFMLPDYLPDITAVLKCRMKPVVQSHQISGDRVLADGTVYLQLLYLDEERRCVHSYEHTQPFTSTFTVKELQGGEAIRFSTKTNYVNCRPTGPRRVDVHGAFGVRLTVCAEQQTEVITAVSGDGIHTRGCTVSGSVLGGYVEKTVSLNEVLELEHTAMATVRHEAAACITDCRRLTGKVIVKGDVAMETVYVTDSQNGTMVKAVHRIPFSQILDIKGLTDEQLCDCHVQVTQCDIRTMQDPAGENRLLSVAIKLLVTVTCYQTSVCDVVTDAYHTGYPLKADTCRVESQNVAFVRADGVTLTSSQALPEGDIAEVLDVWCEPLPPECHAESGQTAVHGQWQVGLLTRDSQGLISYYERLADYDTLLPDTCACVNATVWPLETAFTYNGERVDLRVQAMIERIGTQPKPCHAITHVAVDETAPYQTQGVLQNCCLKLCFAAAGESLWEIARREHTSFEALKEENQLETDILEHNTMLMIPMR